jgi:multidrug efflux pump subunit AcrA (membrane-fusion protein)
VITPPFTSLGFTRCSRSFRRFSPLLHGAFAIAWPALLVLGCDGKSTSTGDSSAIQEIAVAVTAPVQNELPRIIRVSGTLMGDEETTIAAKVAGRVIEVVRDLGDAAAPGDPLIRVDPIDYELARDERQRAFVESLSQLGLSELPAADFNVEQLPSVERARLQAENAKAKYERARVLAEREPPLISEQDFADLKTAWDVAQSELKVERLTAQATLAEARTLEAQVRIAQQRVIDTVHRAPMLFESSEATTAQPHRAPAAREYEVASRMVNVGDYVQIGAPLMRLVDSDPLKLRASVPERRIGAVRAGQAAAVRIEAFVEPFAGEVSRVSPAVDQQTRAFPIEILVQNADRTLKPGSFATADIQVGREAALMVPSTSVISFAGVHKVVLVKDGKAQEQRVELGQRVDGLVEIRKGVSPQDDVVIKPGGSLATGTPVRIAEKRGNDSEARAERTATSGKTEATP